MNKNVLHITCITAMISSCLACADAIPYLAFRSQGFNAARELVGWQTTINKGCMDSFYSSFSITPEYTRSFRSGCLANFLFGDALISNCTSSECADEQCNSNGCSIIKIQGTKVINRDKHALMAENFYLPTDFDGTISVRPVISNWLVDFNLYLGLDTCHPGWYFRIHSPITRTRWALNYCEDVASNGQNNYDPGYFNNRFVGTFDDPDGANVYGIARDQLLTNFTQYAVDGAAISGISGITYEGLRNARFSLHPRTKTALAELTAALGWNFIANENAHLGLQIRAAAPTGNKPRGQYLFEPMVGNGHHWELGAGLSTHFGIYTSQDECRNLSMYIDANVTHLFKSCQWRTFDLCGKPLSRYMLAMKFTRPAVNLQATLDDETFSTPTSQFANVFAPVANFSTIPVEVSYPVQTDVAFKLAFTNNNFQWDLGYDFWYRSCAKFNNKCNCSADGFAPNTWALKGDAFTYGFTPTTEAIGILQPGIPLSATEINATIYQGTNNFPDGILTLYWNQNPGVDNIAAALDDTLQHLTSHQAAITNFQRVSTSLEPVLLQDYALDFDAAKSRGMTHKLFTHFGYMWKQCSCWTPYLGIGGEVEFAQRTQNPSSECCKNNTCDLTRRAATNVTVCCNDNSGSDNNSRSCSLAALSQWGVWIKGGVAFN